MGSKGYFYKPTLLTNVTTKMRISQEEVFGPVALITVVNNEEEAIKPANGSQFGLGSSIWTQNLDKAERLSKLLDVGIVTVEQCGHFLLEESRIVVLVELSRYEMLEFGYVKSV